MNEVTKLPKWAQEMIAQLEMQRDKERNALKRFMDSKTESNISVIECFRDPLFIQSDRVRFRLTNGLIDATVEKDSLELMGIRDGLIIFPHVTNVIQVKLRER